MPTDNVKLSVKATGSKEDLEGKLAKEIEAALQRETGLKLGDVSFADMAYTVTLRGLEGGKPADKTYTGQSPIGIDAAMQDAMKGGVVDFDPDITASLDKTAQAPYFVVPIVSRSLERRKLDRYQESAAAQLGHTYGTRLKRSPDSVTYRVVHLKEHHNNDGELPKGDFRRVTAQGKSDTSIDDALVQVPGGKTPKKTRSTAYEQVASMMVYGAPEPSVQVNQEGRASPVVVTGISTRARDMRASRGSEQRSYARGASPAATEPAKLAHTNALM